MAEVINLRTVRKRAKRQQDEKRAHANRLAFGESKHLRELDDAQREKADRDFDQCRIEIGDR